MDAEIVWTEKVKLNRVLDPLQIYILRHPEDNFLQGITTQTPRLRYYSFLTWAWKNIKEKNLANSPENKILDLEKVITLASANHHLKSDEKPIGIRNLKDAQEFLNSNDHIYLKKLTSFGKKNREGYGNYYYRGSLARLNVVGVEDGKIVVSPAGELISKAYSKTIESFESELWEKSFPKTKIQKMSDACLCTLSDDEKKLWRNIFFGFAKIGPTGTEIENTKLEQDKFHLPISVDLDFIELDEDSFMPEEIEEAINESEPLYNKNNKISHTLLRSSTLFLLLKIVSEISPFYQHQFLHQTIRDAFYYGEAYRSDGTIKEIDFGSLGIIREYWAVYVHNLYYISIFEKALHLVLINAQKNPLGISVDQIVKEIDFKKVLKILEKNGLTVSIENTVDEMCSILYQHLPKGKSSLQTKPNEHLLPGLLKGSNDLNEGITNILLLFLLCRLRFSQFDKNQLQIFSYKETRHVSIKPDKVYDATSKIALSEFPNWLFNFVKNQHRIATAKKFVNSGTQAWLFTEENGMIYFYGKKYDFSAYREAKWKETLELLMDMGLVEKKLVDSEICWIISDEGKKWLKKIQ